MSKKFLASCHCGSVRFSVELSDSFNTVRRCNCSFCRMRGAVTVSAELSGVKVLDGKEYLTEYRFNTKQAAHYFCSKCGIYTFHQRRSNPKQFGINVACLEGVSPFDFESVNVMDGIHHPSDGGGGIIGVITYRKATS